MSLKTRVSKQQYYLNIARQVAERATCLCAHFGCIIVNDDQIISTGYNGAPRHTKDCYELGFCLRRKLGIPSGQQYEICRSVHGEQNAIINAARSGVSLYGGDLYLFGKRVFEGQEALIKAFPCFICKKMIINAGIKNVYGNDENGEVVHYSVEDWIREWTEHDMVEDTTKYDAKYKVAKDEVADQTKEADAVEVDAEEDASCSDCAGCSCGSGKCG